MADFKTEFSTRLKALRTDRNIGIVKATEEIGITYSAYRGYERGKNMPNAEVLACICKYYGVSGDWILGLEGET